MDSTVWHEFEIVHAQIDAICDELDALRRELATLSSRVGEVRSLVEGRESEREA